MSSNSSKENDFGNSPCHPSVLSLWGLMLAAVVALVISFPPPAEGRSPEPSAPKASRAKLTGYEIHFQGNTALSSKQLQEAAAYDLQRFKKKGYRPADADDAAYQMEIAYKNKGYAFAAVSYRYQIAHSKAVVTFEIKEGPRVRIEQIAITGNRAFNDEDLRAFFQSGGEGPLGGTVYFNRSKVEGAVSDIRNFYAQQGFLDAVVEGPKIEFTTDNKGVDIGMKIKEGPRYRIRKVAFAGDLYPAAREELKAVEKKLTGEPYNQQQTLELRSRVSGIYANLGFPDVKVDVRVGQQEKPWQVVLAAEIRSGPKVWISGIEITGAHRTKKSFITSRLTLKKGDLYSAKAQRRSFRALYRTGLFSRVDLTLVPGSDPHHRLLKVAVQELPSRDLSAEVGWGSYELLFLRLGFQKNNLFGTGRTFKTEIGGSTKSADVTASLIDPWFLQTDVTANLPVYFKYREEPSYTSREIGSSVLFSKKLGRGFSVTMGYNYSNTTLSNVDVNADLQGFKDNYNLGSFKAGLVYDTRNDIFFPTRGQSSHVTGEIADTALGGDLAFFRFTVGTSRYYSLGKGKAAVLALRYNTGFIIPRRGQNTIPLGERFFNGGENTVRSFRQDQLGPKDANGNAIGGDAFNVFNIELRHQLRGPLIGTLFFDYGNVSPNKAPVFGTSESELISATFSQYFRDMRPAIGVGLQYLLPIGPARLDVGFNPVARTNETTYAIHFSVGMAF